MEKDRVYIFLNKELSNPQKIVQATHLGIESQRKFGSDSHPSVIVLSVTLSQLDDIVKTLNKRAIKFTEFYEPLFNSVTGLATEAISKELGKYLQHFPMIKEKDFNKIYVDSRQPKPTTEERNLFLELTKHEEN